MSTVLITGASRGIGAAAARRMAAPGVNVALNFARDGTAARAVAEDVRARGAAAFLIQADVSDEASVIGMFQAVTDTFGTLDTLVNNAGVICPIARLEDTRADAIRTVLDVNVLGAFVCAREAVRIMSRDRGGQGGAIVNVSSKAAVLGSPNEFIAYAASKGAIDTLTIGLAKEMARCGVRVNAVRPGLIETDIHAASGDAGRVERIKETVPMGRAGTVEEVADVIAWLASDAASYVTGALIDVSGGR